MRRERCGEWYQHKAPMAILAIMKTGAQEITKAVNGSERGLHDAGRIRLCPGKGFQ